MRRSPLLVGLLVFLMQGCFESHPISGFRPIEPPDGGMPDAGPPGPRPPGRPPGPPRPEPPPTMDTGAFVISTLRMPEPAGGRAPGANLDGMDSRDGSLALDANCEEFNQDFRPPDGRRGIDDAWGTLVPTLEGLTEVPVDEMIIDAILGGRLLIVLELMDGVVGVWLAEPTGPLRASGGRLDPGNTVTAIQPIGRGRTSVSGSRVTVRVGDWNTTISPELSPFLPLASLHDVELRFDRTSASLASGELGGWVEINDAVADASVLMPGIEDTIRSVFESVADIRPIAFDPALCEGLSVGMEFEAVPVRLVR